MHVSVPDSSVFCVLLTLHTGFNRINLLVPAAFHHLIWIIIHLWGGTVCLLEQMHQDHLLFFELIGKSAACSSQEPDGQLAVRRLCQVDEWLYLTLPRPRCCCNSASQCPLIESPYSDNLKPWGTSRQYKCIFSKRASLLWEMQTEYVL